MQTRKESGFLPRIGPPCSLNSFDAILTLGNFKSEQFERRVVLLASSRISVGILAEVELGFLAR